MPKYGKMALCSDLCVYHKYSTRKARKTVDDIFELLKEELVSGGDIILPYIGTLKHKNSKIEFQLSSSTKGNKE